MELGVAEALVSTLDMRSQPTMVARTLVGRHLHALDRSPRWNAER